MTLRNHLDRLGIRGKLLITYSVIIFLTIAVSNLLVYATMKQTIEVNIESELQNSTTTILNMVQTAAAVSLKNYLRSIAEKNREIVSYFHRQQVQGALPETEARHQAAQVLLEQSIGKSGYIYCLNSGGIIDVHPQKTLCGVNISDYAFAREQKQRRQGYLEYDWKNPGEAHERPKALYMTYFAPWDWIISVSAYRAEFHELVNVDDFRDSILSLRFGDTGYSYVIDLKGNLIIHPKLEERNIFDAQDADGRYFIQEICRQKSGKIIYPWKNPGEMLQREKLVIFNHIPEFGWIVASSSYLEEFYAPLHTLRQIFLIAICCAITLVLPFIIRLSASITTPLRDLMKKFEIGAGGDFSVRMERISADEIGQLAAYFNTFMVRLETHIAETKRMEKALMEIGEKERQRIGQDLHDDLCPHLIGIEVLAKVLNQKIEKNAPNDSPLAEKIRELIKEAIRKARTLSRVLLPVYLVDHGLASSIKELVRHTEGVYGIPCAFRCQDDAAFNDHAAATQLFYIIQEALHNAVKHAHADSITVELWEEDGRIRVDIIDDGIGLPDDQNTHGMGLRIMGYRAEKIHATLDIQPHADKGTRVRIALKKRNGEAQTP